MIVHISKNAKQNYIATSSTLEIAKLHQGATQVLKVDTEQMQTTNDLIAIMDLMGLSYKEVAEIILARELDAQPEDTTYWHPCADYGDGEYVRYNGYRMWANGVGNKPSIRGGR